MKLAGPRIEEALEPRHLWRMGMLILSNNSKSNVIAAEILVNIFNLLARLHWY